MPGFSKNMRVFFPGLCWAYVGPMLGPCWVIWWAMWGSMEVSGMKNSSPTENFSVAILYGAILCLTETSWNSIVKNKAILRDFLQKWKVECSADSLVPMRFAIFPLHLSKVLRLPRNDDLALQILFKCPTPAIVFGNATRPSRFAHFCQGAQSLAPATRNDI